MVSKPADVFCRISYNSNSDELVMRCRNLASLKKTTSRNYNSLANWMYNEKPLSREESEFIDCDEDFIALCEVSLELLPVDLAELTIDSLRKTAGSTELSKTAFQKFPASSHACFSLRGPSAASQAIPTQSITAKLASVSSLDLLSAYSQ